MPGLTAADLLTRSPVIPVAVLDDPDHAVPLARALLAGGIGVIEITPRTPAALAAISAIAATVPGTVVGAGTVTTPGLTPPDAVAGQDWQRIEALAARATRAMADSRGG